VLSGPRPSGPVRRSRVPPRRAAGCELVKYMSDVDAQGLMASIDDDGVMRLYIVAGKDTPGGSDMFNEALGWAGGADNLTGIGGSWTRGRTAIWPTTWIPSTPASRTC
jgi:hypothetical protein